MTHWKTAHTASTVAIIIAIPVIGLLLPSRLLGWILTLALLTLFTFIAGRGITGLWRGALIDERNRISLSRLQLILWTLLVLSAYLTAAFGNLSGDYAEPLAIAIPGDLWVLMGISTTSLVASPLLKTNKMRSTPDQAQERRTRALLASQGVDDSKVKTEGLIVVNAEPGDAQWSDLFKGEESGNAGLLDMAKIQMFYFTLIAVIAYASALGRMFWTNAFPVGAFPDFAPGMIALLGISHGGYLTNKAIPHSKTA
jgi:hypothetical protein